jgi:hypothetical protein
VNVNGCCEANENDAFTSMASDGRMRFVVSAVCVVAWSCEDRDLLSIPCGVGTEFVAAGSAVVGCWCRWFVGTPFSVWTAAKGECRASVFPSYDDGEPVQGPSRPAKAAGWDAKAEGTEEAEAEARAAAAASYPCWAALWAAPLASADPILAACSATSCSPTATRSHDAMTVGKALVRCGDVAVCFQWGQLWLERMGTRGRDARRPSIMLGRHTCREWAGSVVLRNEN